MNKLQESRITENHEILSEEQQILNDAEHIIKQFDNRSYSTKGKKIVLFYILPSSILVLLILFFSTIFAFINLNSNTIINGIFIHGIDVSGLTTEEAKEKVSKTLNEQLANSINLVYKDYSVTILPSDFEACYDIDSAVNTAYSIGHSNNIFVDNFSIVNALSKNINVSPQINYDIDLLNSIIKNINSNIPDLVVQPSYYIDGTTLTITNGKDGIIVNSNELADDIIAVLNDFTSTVDTIKIPVINKTADSIDIESIYKNIRKDPVDAYYTTSPYALYPSSNGLDFDISIEDAKSMISSYQEEYNIPLKTLYPNVSTNQIGTEAFPDLLSEFSTSFSSSNSNRSTNITLAASKINGVVLMPGETFSYNQTVGQRTKAAGFKEAAAYSNGEVVSEVGGGICQVSSTLYNAVLYANLEITERYNHGFKTSYVKPGLDATVSWGGPDFKFTNNRNYPIKIICDTTGKTLRIYIYGLKTDNDYKVELEATYLSTVYAKTVYKTDSSLASGASKVIQSGSNGCKTATYKILYDSAGNFVSKECISQDTYNAHNKIVAVGP